MPKLVNTLVIPEDLGKKHTTDKYSPELVACTTMLQDPKSEVFAQGYVLAEFPSTLTGKITSISSNADQKLRKDFGAKFRARTMDYKDESGQAVTGVFIFTAKKWAELMTSAHSAK